MNKRFHSSYWLFLILSATTAPTGVSSDDLRSQVSSAQKLIEQEKWDGARDVLDRVDAACHAEGDPRSCRDLVDYSFAYFAQSLAGANADSRETNLREAERRYEAVLVHVPDNAATLSNLAQVEQSLLSLSQDPLQRQTLITLIQTRLQTAITADPVRAASYELSLGDFLVAQNRSEEALLYYRRASSGAPHPELAFQRILEYSTALANDTCRDWEDSSPDLAASCYEKIMRGHATAAGAEDSIAQGALSAWTSLVARHDMLTPDRVKALPRPWPTTAITELENYIREPLKDPRLIWRWWWERPSRAAITAEVTVAMGRQFLVEGPSGAAKTEKCWQAFLNAQPRLAEEVVVESHSSMPSPEKNGLSGVLLLYQELASLYYQHPELDPLPKQAKLSEMVDQLFQGKAIFLHERNWKATQSFHTTLALIFAERGQWGKEGRSDSPLSATYQLRAALDDAVNRQNDPHERFFQPLPELKALLGEAYSQVERPADARTEYVRAAMAYLDVDGLERAEDMLRLVGKDDPAAVVLAKILSMRRHPDQVALSTLNVGKCPWLFSPLGNLDLPFLSRQRFKILADLVNALEGKAPSERLDAAFRAYQESKGSETTLVGTTDLLRYQTAESVLLASANAQSQGFGIVYATWTPDSEKVSLSLPGQQGPSYIKRDPQASVAEKVVSTIGPFKTYTVHPFIKLNKGELFVMPNNHDQRVGSIFQELANNPDLHITIMPSTGTV